MPSTHRNGQADGAAEDRAEDGADDGTRQLLRGGSLILLIGVAAIGLLMTVLGGVGVEGAHNNLGWLALITGAMCLPFGLMLTALGLAKWLRKHNLYRKP